MSLLTLYGIKNCDTVRKARAWLDEQGVAYAFHDFKAQGVERARLAAWCNALSWEKVLNRAGTTFRGLDEGKKHDLTEDKAIALMLQAPSLIKRPVLEGAGVLKLGFKTGDYDDLR